MKGMVLNNAEGCSCFIVSEDYPVIFRGKHVTTVKKGFVSDGASVPFILTGFISRSGKNLRAAVVHDWIYRKPHVKITRRTADIIFKSLLKEDGVGFKRNLMYIAVSMFGCGAYEERKG